MCLNLHVTCYLYLNYVHTPLVKTVAAATTVERKRNNRYKKAALMRKQKGGKAMAYAIEKTQRERVHER